MAEVLVDVDEAFESDPAIDEIGIVMCPPPPNVVLIDHKLGLSYKILKPLFVHAISEFYVTLIALKHGHINLSDPLVVDKVMRLTRATLVVKGDMPMFYNLRKRVLREGRAISNLEKELCFLRLLFTKHPKSPSSWQHRKWCLNERYFHQQVGRIPSSSSLTREHILFNGKYFLDRDEAMMSISELEILPLKMTSSEIQIELDLCTKMSESYPKNYYSWMHRLWLLQFMNFNQLESEMSFTKIWLNSHVSDHSCSSHRQEVIIRILSLISAISGRYKSDILNQNTCTKDSLDNADLNLIIHDQKDRGNCKINLHNNNNNNNNDNNHYHYHDNGKNVSNYDESNSSGDNDNQTNQEFTIVFQYVQLRTFLEERSTNLDFENSNQFEVDQLSFSCQQNHIPNIPSTNTNEIGNITSISPKNVHFDLRDDNDKIYFQFLFLESVVKESKQLILDRPGK